METSDVEAVPVFHAQLKDDTPVARWKSSGLYVAEVETMEGPMGPSGVESVKSSHWMLLNPIKTRLQLQTPELHTSRYSGWISFYFPSF
jgi:hypothetical protein